MYISPLLTLAYALSRAPLAISEPPAQEEPKPSFSLNGVMETFFYAIPHAKGVRHRLSWAEFRARYGAHWSATSSFTVMPNATQFDEQVVEYENASTGVAVGRMRMPFGFASWSELVYTPIVNLPFIKAMMIRPDLFSIHSDTGVKVRQGFGPTEVTVAYVDTNNARFDVLPNHADTAFARIQTGIQNAIIGVSGFTKISGRNNSKSTLIGTDVRLTWPHTQLRFEWNQSESGTPKPGGFYADLFWRPPGATRTQFGIRTEQARNAFSPKVAKLTSIGVRHQFDPHLTLSASYGFGNSVKPAANCRGWSIQALFAIKF